MACAPPAESVATRRSTSQNLGLTRDTLRQSQERIRPDAGRVHARKGSLSLSANKSRQRLDAVNGGGRRWASIDYTAEYLGVHKVTVKNMIADGRITAYRLGRRVVRIDLNEVDRSLVAYGGAVG